MPFNPEIGYLQQSSSMVRKLPYKQTTVPSCCNFIVRTTYHHTWRTSGLNSRPNAFQLYMNDQPEVIEFSNIESFVDDPKMYFSFASKDIDSCLRRGAEDLQHVAEPPFD